MEAKVRIWHDSVLYISHYYIIFFKINNLLHRACRQTMIATFVTIYKGPKLHEKERKKKKKKKKNNKIKEKGERENIINKKNKIILANHKMKMHLG